MRYYHQILHTAIVHPHMHQVLPLAPEPIRNTDGDSLTFTDDKGRSHRCQWVNNLPFNGSKDADDINFFQYEMIRNDKITYRNSWVIDIPVNAHNVVDLVKGGVPDGKSKMKRSTR